MEVQCAGRGLRKMQLKVLHLDDTVHTFQLSVHATGQELHASMVDRLHLLESDYFDLEYVNDEGMRCWLDHDKPILRQISPGRDLLFRFGVKFYTPYPNLLDEECTRYLFALQVKRDLVTGTLLCSENTAALLASYVVQAEIGDFLEEEYHTIEYLRPLKLLHDPTDDRLQRVMEFHKAHIGLSPSEADLALLDTARKVEFYGLRLHFVRNHEGLGLNLAVSHLGILVFQNLIRINTFSWAKIRKLSFKRKRFLVKLQPERFDNIEFIFDSREECKHFWKHCIEHHTFFRCPKAEQAFSKQAQPGQRFSRSGSTFRYTGRTEQELHEYVQEHGENRINFERPSSARRAYSTLLSGSSYTSKRLQTASLQLRSSSADRRTATMFSNNLGVSLTNSLGHSSGLKRTQSEGTRPAANDSQEESAVMVSGKSNADELPEAPTSGYVTTTESAGSRQSTDANTVPETEEDIATNMERLEGEQVSEMDPLRWITETYRRMTGDWTGDGVLAEEKQDTSMVMRRAKSAAGSPRTSGTASLGRLDTELDSLLLHQQQGAPTVQIAAADDDGALTHFLLLSEISRTIVPGATIQTGPETSQSERQGDTSVQVSSPTEQQQQQQQASDILSDLTGAVLFSGADISDLVSRVVSPYPELSSEREEIRVSSSLSTTQPDLLSQADTGLSQRGFAHPATDLFGDTHRIAASLADTGTQQPIGSEAASAVSSFLTQPTGAQIQQTPTEFLDDLNLRAGQSAVFILPTVTQYGLDINIDRSQQQIRSFDPTPGEAVSSTLPPHHSEAKPTTQSNVASESIALQNYSLQSGFPYTQTSWSTVTPAYSVPSVPEPDGRKFVLASVHPEPLTYGAGQTAAPLKNKFQGRQPKSNLGTSLLSSRSTSQIPASGVSTTSYPFFPSDPVEVRRSRPSIEPLQATPFDRWSSSGSDSTTGVILRPESSKTELGDGNIRTNSSGSLLRQHKTGCPHASVSTRQSQPSMQVTSAMSITSSNQLPVLPVDTLPARPSHHRNMLAHTCGQSSNLSHSIPCDVHLSGLHAEMRRMEAYRHPGGKDSDVSKNTKKTSNERQLRRPYPRGYPFGGGGEHAHPDVLPMELTDSAAAEMLEEVPYVVIRRPRSVDVKQYQLHLQRQQQQAAAMAAAAAGYPFHPGAPPFFGESHHHHAAAAAAAAAAAYHYGGRMPVAPPFTYGPMPTAYHHHHHQAPVAPGRSELPPDIKCGRSGKHHSVGPGDPRLDARQERARQARPSQQASHYHEGPPEGLDPYAAVAPMHREKCKAKRKHSKTPESSMVKEYDANRSKRHEKPATDAAPAPDDVLHHHAQCVHRRRLMDPNLPEESTEKRAVMQAKRHIRPKPTRPTIDSGSKQPTTRTGSAGRSPSRTKDVPVLEAGDSRQKRRTAEPVDDSRETEVPYPVSEIFFSPSRGSEPADARQGKLSSATRHHHHHHPACASLMGRARASQLQKQLPKPAKIVPSDAALASSSVPQLQRSQLRDETAPKLSARSWASDDKYPLDRGSIVPQARADRMSRKQEDSAVRPVMSDTRETIEKLRQELRSAGFQVKDTLPSRAVTDWGRPSSMESGHQPTGTKPTTKPSHRPVDKTSPSRQKPTEVAHGFIESRKPTGTPSDVTKPDKPVAQAADSLATAGGVDLPFGGPPRNPVYLDSDTDSDEVSRQRTEPDAVSRPQDSQDILREPLSTTASTMETIEAPAGGQEVELSVDVPEPGHVQPAISPRSPSPSLPLSFVPCDGADDETDVSLGSQASLLNSPDSASYCSTCDRVDSYGSLSPSSSHSCCHSRHCRRYHSSCHGHRRRRHHHHGHGHHDHYHSHRYYHRNYTCLCHSCVSHHHRRHLSDQRNAYRESRHHSVKPYRASHRVGSSPRRHQRSSSDRRHGYGTSSSEPSELSWTNSLSESSAQDEIPGDHWIEDALTLERRSMIVEELLMKEQKLRAQIAKHRALAYELKQTREQTQKLLGAEPRRQAGRFGRKSEVANHSKEKGMDDSVRSTSKKELASEASSHKGSTAVSRQKEGVPTKEDKHLDDGRPDGKHGVKKDERTGTRQSHAVRPARHYRHLHPNRRHPGSKSSSRSPRDRSTDLRDSFLENQAAAVQDDFVIENTAALADGDGEFDSPEKPSVDLKDETQTKVVEDGKGESAEERQPTQMTLATMELEDIEENTVYPSDIELQTTSFVQSVEPQQACMLSTGTITSVEVTEPPQPPPTAPPLAACISSTVDTSPSDFVTTSGEQVAQAMETAGESIETKPKPQLSSINQLSDLDASADQTDADSEYDGTHVINMLSEIIENSLSEMRLTDSQDQHTTDGSTQASSVCDDLHTSEASMETVKAAHSPTRLGSPSNSSTSASEGSEDIEPFPPPPPESLVDLYLAHDGTLTHTHHLFAGALDEVIEEECAAEEPESDVCGTTVQSDADSTLVERTTDEEKQDSSSPEPKVGENLTAGELTIQVEVNAEAANEQASIELEISANEAEQQGSALDSAQAPGDVAPEDVQMNKDINRDTVMPENSAHQSEDVDNGTREEAELPSDAAGDENTDEQSVDQCAIDSPPPNQTMAAENSPDQPATADACDQTECNEVILDTNET